ncbi:MAG: NAD-binding protein, partial [bacterium]|nr:NAD-binding protein [bacterium]
EKPLVKLMLIALSLTLISAIALAYFEYGPNEHIHGFIDGLWWALIFVLSGFEQTPVTTAGRLIALSLVLFGLTFLGLFTAAVSSLLIEQKLGIKRRFDPMKLEGHVIICGYNSRVKGIIEQLQAVEVTDRKPVVVLTTDLDPKTDLGPLAMVLCGDSTNEHDLLRAGVQNASVAIILGEINGSSGSNSDAKAVLTTLAIASINPNCRTCVEVADPANIPHLKYANANEIISTGGFSANLLGQAALYPGITQVYEELLSNTYGNEIFQLPTPTAYVGMSIRQLHHLLVEKGCILIGVRRTGDDQKASAKLNPPLDLIITCGDELLLISECKPQLK